MESRHNMAHNCPMAYFFSFIIFLSFAAHAQIKDLNIELDSRYDAITDYQEAYTSRLQGRVRVGMTFDAMGRFQLVGLAETGPAYGNSWEDLHDFTGGNDEKRQLLFRKLYLQKAFGDTVIKAGSLGGLDSIGSGGVSRTGWIDGVSADIKAQGARLKVVLGSLYDTDNPNVFTRKRRLNFAEIEISKRAFHNLLLSAGYERQQKDFLKGKAVYTVESLGRPIVDLFASVLYDLESSDHNYEVGASADVLDLFTDGHRNYLKMDLYYTRLDPGLNFRNALYGGYYQDGNAFVARLSGKIGKKGKVKWNVRNSFGKKNRFDAGIAIDLFRK